MTLPAMLERDFWRKTGRYSKSAMLRALKEHLDRTEPKRGESLTPESPSFHPLAQPDAAALHSNLKGGADD